MPVTAKLSRRFYEHFGDELTNELVEWFNAVDSTYRSDLRDTNAANFTRFDARLKQRVAELEATIDRRYAALDAKVDHRYTALDSKMDERFRLVDERFNRLDVNIDSRFIQQAAELRETLAVTIAASESRMLRWMFTLWTGGMVTLAGLLLAILRSR